MRKKILIFSHDPGGANAVYPLIDAFRSRGHEVLPYANGYACRKILEHRSLPKDNIDGVLNDVAPDFIVTGTSSSDVTEKFLWIAARKHNIPTMAILDHWCNYGIRFSNYRPKDLDKYRVDKTFDFLPSHICVMNDFAKKEMQDEGIPGEIIHPFGNPHFASMISKSKNVDVAKIRAKFPSNKQIITFASEPYEEDYGYEISPERKALDDIVAVLKRYEDLTLVVKLHPRERKNKYAKSGYSGCIFDREMDSIDMVVASNLVISVTSMFTIEACILGKKALSYQPSESNKDNFVLTRNGVLPFLNNRADLDGAMDTILNTEKILYNFTVDFCATENIVVFVEGIICRN
ncbi:MAG: DUF354 domain-containing protein [Holosporaceae bacterium]|jgi:hypothetical protein|nr:DUF354 domain-containing protein [Holosporaceae bacterium]